MIDIPNSTNEVKTTSNIFIYDWSYETDSTSTQIHIFGLNELNETICLTVDNFLPYLYIELPMSILWDKPRVQLLLNSLNPLFGSAKPVKKTIANRKRLYYAHKTTNMEEQYYTYLCCSFTTNKHFRSINYKLSTPIRVAGIGNVQLKVHEYNASVILQLACLQNIPMSGWAQFTGIAVPSYEQTTYCKYEYVVPFKQLHRAQASFPFLSTVPQPCICSFDIEVYSANPNAMPKPENISDCIFQISCIFWTQNKSSSAKSFLLSLGNPTPEVVGIDITTKTYCNEASLIKGFSDLVLEHNPQLITGYNILGFDIPYLLDRAKLTMTSPSLHQIGMVRSKSCAEITDKWTSAAYGTQEFRYLDLDGRVFIDLLSFARREFKFSSYKLNSVAQHFLNASKDPLSAKDIFVAYQQGMVGGPDGDKAIAICGKYCVQDTALVQQLFEVFDTWIGLTETSAVCNVPISYLYTKGQQIKVFSQVYSYCYENKIVVENNAYVSDGKEQYQGATVLEPNAGLYEYIVPYDFKSLYPTLIIAYNIDYSTLVKDNDSIPDEMCHVIEWKEHVDCPHCVIHNPSSKQFACQDYKYKFLKEPKGVLPTIIENLLNARKKTRDQIKSLKKKAQLETCPKEKLSIQTFISVLNKRQLSFKVAANSMYGALGVKKGYLPCMPAAMSITAMGRENLLKAVSFLRDKCGATIVYGDTDSCYTQFPSISPENLWAHARDVESKIVNANIFPKPMELEFENEIYGQFLILSKKRYMWKNFNEDGILVDKIGKKGVLIARRDNSEFARNMYEHVVSLIFEKKSFNDIFYYIVQQFNQCCASTISYKQFVISKSIKPLEEYKIRELSTDNKKRIKRLQHLKCTEKEYDICALPAHIQLAEKMRKRGQRVDTGQRIEYLITTMGDTKAILSHKIEEPEYQQKFSSIIKIDYLYYIHSLATALDQLLEIVYPSSISETHYIYSAFKANKLFSHRLKRNVFPTYRVKQNLRTGGDTAHSARTDHIEYQHRLRLLKSKMHDELRSYFAPRIEFESIPKTAPIEYAKLQFV